MDVTISNVKTVQGMVFQWNPWTTNLIKRFWARRRWFWDTVYIACVAYAFLSAKVSVNKTAKMNYINNVLSFLRAKAAMLSARLIAILSICPSVYLSVRLSVTRVDQQKWSKLGSPNLHHLSAAWKTSFRNLFRSFSI